MEYLSKRIVGFIISMGLLCQGCGNGNDRMESNYIIGTVVDSNGVGISSAIIQISYFTTEHTIGSIQKVLSKACPNTPIDFDVPDSEYVKLWITRYNCTDTVNTIFDGPYNSSLNGTLIWNLTNQDGKIVRNDVYMFHLITDEGYVSKPVLINNQYPNIADDLNEFEYYAITDTKGRFEICLDDIACSYDAEFDKTDDSGEIVNKLVISDYIKIWSMHPDYYTSIIDSVLIDVDQSISVSIPMSR